MYYIPYAYSRWVYAAYREERAHAESDWLRRLNPLWFTPRRTIKTELPEMPPSGYG